MWVGLVGMLLIEQALSLFVPLLKKWSPILNNFAKAFGEYDKACWATTKFDSLHKGHILYWLVLHILGNSHATSTRMK